VLAHDVMTMCKIGCTVGVNNALQKFGTSLRFRPSKHFGIKQQQGMV
jgi:hypothetical protein